MTSESLPLDAGALAGTTARAPGSPWLRLVLAFLGSAFAGAALLLALLVGIQVAYAGRALPGVRVGGVDLGGLTRADAAGRLEASLPSLDHGTLSLVIGGETVPLDYGELGREYDSEGMLDSAFAVGRDGSPLARGVEELRALVRGADVTPLVRWNDAALATALRTSAEGFDRVAVDAAVSRDDAARLVTSEATFGRRLDQAAAAADVRAILAAPDAPAETSVQVRVQPVLPRVLTSQAEYARYRAELLSSLDLTTRDGADTWVIPADQVRSWVSFEPAPFGGLRVDVVGPQMAASLATLAKDVARNPKDAAFLTGKSGQIVGVVEGLNGRTLDVPGSMAAISAALADYEEGSPPPDVKLAIIVTPPKLTTEEANKIAPLMTRIGTWTTYFPPGEGNFNGANIQIPARIISGTVVLPGAWFSFWDTVGIPTVEQGYGPGGFIKNGRSTIGALAGGVCSTSTTLFNAAVRAGLQIGIRYNHYYYIPRYPLGLDATVSMYSWTVRQDMTFRNDTAHPLLIRSINSDGVVTFEIYGVPDGRTVSFSTPVVKNVVKASDHTIYTTAIPAGTQKRVEFPHDGMDVWVTRTVTLNGEVIHQETYFSDYKKVDGELWIGVAPEPAPEPTPSASTTATFYV